MDNFRKFKNPSNSRPNRRTDGFIPAHRLVQRPAKRPDTEADNRAHSLGNFKSTDGFTKATPRKVITTTRPVGRQPKRDAMGRIELNLPESSPKKRRKTSRIGRHKASRVVLKTSIALIVSGVLVGGYLFGKGYLKARQIFKGGGSAAALQENVDPAKLKGEGDGRVNILLLGKGGTRHTGGELTDTILIASVDPIHKEASILSIPRDLYVKSKGSYMKINAVYANSKSAVLNGRQIDNQQEKAEEAGFSAIEQVVEDSMGIPVHYHMMIDFDGFKRAIDTVGGIDVDVTDKTSLYEVQNIDGRRYTLDVKPGRQHFDGFRALAYARSRMASPRGDFDRGERQRLILIALKDKVFSVGTFGNPLKISQLISDFGDNMKSNLSTNEVMRLYEIGKDIPASKIDSVGLADPPNNYVQTDNIGGQSVVVPRAGLDDFSEIKNYVRNKLKDGYIRNENASIAVYNGTDIGGLAGRRANDLKSYGYNITTVADAPTKNYPNTVLVDLRDGQKKYTKNYLEKRLNTTAVNKMPDGTINPGNADFVIILGNNEANNY